VDPYPIRDDSANEPIQGTGTADGAYEDRHPSRVAIILGAGPGAGVPARGALRPLVLGSGLVLSYLLHPDPILWWMVALAVATYVAWPSARMLLGIRAEDMPAEPAAQRSPSVPATPVHA
jgi:hypothetical protein